MSDTPRVDWLMEVCRRLATRIDKLEEKVKSLEPSTSQVDDILKLWKGIHDD